MSEYKVEDCECVSNAIVYGLDESVKRAKFPMTVNINNASVELTEGIKTLAQCAKGTAHDQWLTGVIVQFDLNFSNKAWIEAERYHFLDFVSSQSTMHRISKFNLEETYNEYVDKRIVEIMKEKVKDYNDYCVSPETSLSQSQEALRIFEDEKRRKYLEILYSNPAGFRITAGMTTNYRQLKTIYSQRKNHRLPEWRVFCRWIETLPCNELITGINKKDDNEVSRRDK